jgi:virulence factor
VRRRGDWVPVARQRGIEQITLAFLDAVRAGTVLDARDALATHELCERIVTEVREQAL